VLTDLVDGNAGVLGARAPPAGQQLRPAHDPLARAVSLLVEAEQPAAALALHLVLRPHVLHAGAVSVAGVGAHAMRLVRVLSQVLPPVLHLELGVALLLLLLLLLFLLLTEVLGDGTEAVFVRAGLLGEGLRAAARARPVDGLGARRSVIIGVFLTQRLADLLRRVVVVNGN